MTKFLPIFPLDIVVYPGQHLNLHIYEPRYKQLINECKTEGKTFGIPSVFKETLNEYGTEMELLEISEVYDNGEMDIKTNGLKIFRIMEVLREVPEKLYSAAIVVHLAYFQQLHLGAVSFSVSLNTEGIPKVLPSVLHSLISCLYRGSYMCRLRCWPGYTTISNGNMGRNLVMILY